MDRSGVINCARRTRRALEYATAKDAAAPTKELRDL